MEDLIQQLENASRDHTERLTLRISIDADLDFLWAVVPGEVIDGHLEDETEEVADGAFLWTRGPGGPLIGFGVDDLSEFEPGDDLWHEPRFDVPTLGLENAPIAAIALRARATVDGSTPDVELFDYAVYVGNSGGGSPEEVESAWREALAAGDLKAHFALGYTLVDRGRPDEAYGHLKAYTRIVPRNSWAWVWLGRACTAMGELDEARECYRRAIEAEAQGSYETDADELLEALS